MAEKMGQQRVPRQHSTGFQWVPVENPFHCHSVAVGGFLEDGTSPAATANPKKSQRGYSLVEDCRGTARDWLNRMQMTSEEFMDFSNWNVLKWWRRYRHYHPKIVDLVRRRLCVKASSATSERAFSKAELIISKNRQQ